MLPSADNRGSRPPDPPGGRARASAAYQACAVIIGLAPAALILIFGHGLPLRNLALPALISALFALFAWLLRGVNRSGALAGFGVAFALYESLGWQGFVLLLWVFLITWIATRLGHRRKQQRGLAESQSGRDAAQVVANVGLAGMLVVVPFISSALTLACIAGALAVLAEAAADTCSSEIGKGFAGRTVLITDLRPVAPGTDGGVSRLGFLAAFVASGSTMLLFKVLHPGIELLDVLVLTAVGVVGCAIDSVLGATLERRGWVNNDGVNLLSTATVAFLAGMAVWLFVHGAP